MDAIHVLNSRFGNWKKINTEDQAEHFVTLENVKINKFLEKLEAVRIALNIQENLTTDCVVQIHAHKMQSQR